MTLTASNLESHNDGNFVDTESDADAGTVDVEGRSPLKLAWSRFRKDKIAEQVFYQGPSTNKNKYDFPTLAEVDVFQAAQLQKPAGVDFWDWIKTGKMPV